MGYCCYSRWPEQSNCKIKIKLKLLCRVYMAMASFDCANGRFWIGAPTFNKQLLHKLLWNNYVASMEHNYFCIVYSLYYVYFFPSCMNGEFTKTKMQSWCTPTFSVSAFVISFPLLDHMDLCMIKSIIISGPANLNGSLISCIFFPSPKAIVQCHTLIDYII